MSIFPKNTFTRLRKSKARKSTQMGSMYASFAFSNHDTVYYVMIQVRSICARLSEITHVPLSEILQAVAWPLYQSTEYR